MFIRLRPIYFFLELFKSVLGITFFYEKNQYWNNKKGVWNILLWYYQKKKRIQYNFGKKNYEFCKILAEIAIQINSYKSTDFATFLETNCFTG